MFGSNYFGTSYFGQSYTWLGKTTKLIKILLIKIADFVTQRIVHHPYIKIDINIAELAKQDIQIKEFGTQNIKMEELTKQTIKFEDSRA